MNCIQCHGSGRCHFCNGQGRSGMSSCIQCHGSGKCTPCNGTGQAGGRSLMGSFQSGPQLNVGSVGFGGGNQFDQSKQLAGNAIAKLQSQNPMERREAITILNSHEAFFGQKMAYESAIQLYPNETDPLVKKGLLDIISKYSGGKDSRAFQILELALNDLDTNIIYTAIWGLASFKEQAANVLPKIRELYNNPAIPSMSKRAMMRVISEIGNMAEPALDIVARELGSNSWLMRKASRNAMKTLNKKGLNMVGYLIKQLEEGDINQKVAAATGIGELGDEAKGAVTALVKTLMDPIPDVRSKAAWALYKMNKNAAPAESALKQAVNDECSSVAKFALNALKNIKKLTDNQKQEIKALEEIEKEIKAWRKKFINMYPDPKEEKEEDGSIESIESKKQEFTHLFFMSHALPDFTWVKKAMDVIESWEGCRVWTCERDIPTGGDWLEEIYKGLEQCTFYILFWSDNAEKSKWTNEEIREAKVRNVSKEKPILSVVNLGKSDWPKLLARAQGAMVKSDEDLNQWLTNLKTRVFSSP